jgi:hypothetical protein
MIVNNNIESIKNFKYCIMIGIIILFLLNFICFFISWILGVTNSRNTYFVVLSYFLATDQNARTVYLIWYISYIILNILLLYVLVKNDLTVIDNTLDEVASRIVHCSFDTKNKLYRFCTLAAIPVNLLRLFAFFLLYNFDMTNYSNEHYVWTAIAMIGSTIWCFFLFVRRLCARVYIHIHEWVYLVYAVNACTIILQIVFIALLPSAPDSTRGIFELMVAIFIGVDPVYQISDIYLDYKCNTTLQQHEIKRRYGKKLSRFMEYSNDRKVTDINSINDMNAEVTTRIVSRVPQTTSQINSDFQNDR